MGWLCRLAKHTQLTEKTQKKIKEKKRIFFRQLFFYSSLSVSACYSLFGYLLFRNGFLYLPVCYFIRIRKIKTKMKTNATKFLVFFAKKKKFAVVLIDRTENIPWLRSCTRQIERKKNCVDFFSALGLLEHTQLFFYYWFSFRNNISFENTRSLCVYTAGSVCCCASKTVAATVCVRVVVVSYCTRIVCCALVCARIFFFILFVRSVDVNRKYEHV